MNFHFDSEGLTFEIVEASGAINDPQMILNLLGEPVVVQGVRWKRRWKLSRRFPFVVRGWFIVWTFRWTHYESINERLRREFGLDVRTRIAE